MRRGGKGKQSEYSQLTKTSVIFKVNKKKITLQIRMMRLSLKGETGDKRGRWPTLLLPWKMSLFCLTKMAMNIWKIVLFDGCSDGIPQRRKLVRCLHSGPMFFGVYLVYYFSMIKGGPQGWYITGYLHLPEEKNLSRFSSFELKQNVFSEYCSRISEYGLLMISFRWALWRTTTARHLRRCRECCAPLIVDFVLHG